MTTATRTVHTGRQDDHDHAGSGAAVDLDSKPAAKRTKNKKMIRKTLRKAKAVQNIVHSDEEAMHTAPPPLSAAASDALRSAMDAASLDKPGKATAGSIDLERTTKEAGKTTTEREHIEVGSTPAAKTGNRPADVIFDGQTLKMSPELTEQFAAEAARRSFTQTIDYAWRCDSRVLAMRQIGLADSSLPQLTGALSAPFGMIIGGSMGLSAGVTAGVITSAALAAGGAVVGAALGGTVAVAICSASGPITYYVSQAAAYSFAVSLAVAEKVKPLYRLVTNWVADLMNYISWVFSGCPSDSRPDSPVAQACEEQAQVTNTMAAAAL